MSLLLREAIGGTIRRARTERRRTLRDVSGEARVSLGYLSEIERGRKEPSSELLAAICDALSLPLPDLLDDVADALRPTPAEALGSSARVRPARAVLAPVDPALRSAVEEAFEAGAAVDADGAELDELDGATAGSPATDAPPAGPAEAPDAAPADDGATARLVPLVAVPPGHPGVPRIVCSAA